MKLAIICDLKDDFEEVKNKAEYKVLSFEGTEYVILDVEKDLEENLKLIEKLDAEDCLKTQIKPLLSAPVDNAILRKIDLLTERENEVLTLVTKGFSNKEIAKRLFLSEKTVKNHLNNIFKKIDVKDRTNAALYAIKAKRN